VFSPLRQGGPFFFPPTPFPFDPPSGNLMDVKRLPQASAVPYRLRAGGPEYLLITTRKGRWIFPKGIIDPGETPQETALKEAHEEAGIRGRLGPTIGTYDYEKWESRCEVTVFLLEVEAEDSEWLEGAVRRRAWFSYHEAREKITGEDLLRMLEMAHTALNSGGIADREGLSLLPE
jgi:8-oxo-dGTP pyrophosphatase MutT (NUDIX family)